MRTTIILFKTFILLLVYLPLAASIDLGVDTFFQDGYAEKLQGKRVGLITNQTGVNRNLRSTIDLILEHSPKINLVALFAPEHGLHGNAYAAEEVVHSAGPQKIPVFSLYGKTRRPSAEMLKNIDALIYDIQDIGCRPYTYTTTLLYAMEEAAKKGIEIIVLDRPNPLNGVIVDGPMLQEKWRSFIGYINIPYCHGMTVGEIASFFNTEYGIGCKLTVVPMKGWKRTMSFAETGLNWVPTSPNVPEADTPHYCAATGLLGELSLTSIGIGYTLPFKVVGAPWIDANEFAQNLNTQKLPGVQFLPFHFRPFYGAYHGKECHGIRIVVTDPLSFRPQMCQYMILGLLKTLYPQEVEKHIGTLSASKKDLFYKASGNEEMLAILKRERYSAWKLILFQKEEREQFLLVRKKYLLYP